MSETDLTNKNLMNELQLLADELKARKEKNKEESHTFKVDQQQDGSTDFVICAGNY
ncbi:MAG: hypothetical protein PV340_04940 [Wolbachia sp.]|nr:hypothetical protein [Wolbachia sp.]MDD9336234.1 hypothetical protein [Wolbachia sp.]